MHYTLLLTSVLLQLAYAQIGTITQDIYTYAAFSQQKSCARSCFQYGNLCPIDVLGFKIGCAQSGSCETKSWQARNDCYCKSDLQAPAQEHLNSCISDACSVVDVSIDAQAAVSIYSRYCSEKGYTAGLPATVQANPTDSAGTPQGTTATTTKASRLNPTSSSTSSSTPGTTGTSSESSKLSLSAIIGIVVGSLAGLAFLAVALWFFWKFLSPCFRKKQSYQNHLPLQDHKPVYPVYPDHQAYYPTPTPGSDVGPGDSVSMVGGVAPPAPTLISDTRYPGRY